MPHGTVVSVVLSGHDIKLRSRTPDLAVATSCLSGEFEILRYTLPKQFDGCIVDAGGYIGTAALALNELFPSASILCIEPAANNLAILKKNVGNVGNITVISGALTSGKSENIKLVDRSTGEWGYSVVVIPEDANEAAEVGFTKAITLPDIVQQYGKIGLLKLDIEGGEKELLEKCGDAMDKVDVVFAELHDRIISGCTKLFFDFSESRILIKDSGEKYLSIAKNS